MRSLSLAPSPVRIVPVATTGSGRPIYEADEPLCVEAMRTARLRRDCHAVAGNERHWGDPGDYSDEYYGSIGPLVFEKHCRARKIDLELAPLYVPNSRLKELPPWDARIGGVTLEIKTTPPDSLAADGRLICRKLMLVKQSEIHHSDLYVAVKFESPSRYWFAGFATLEEVLAAPSFTKFARAFSLRLDRLHDLIEADCFRPPVVSG